MNNIDYENRLSKLERCFNKNKIEFGELEQRLPVMFERINEQLRTRPTERFREVVHPEFERDADRLSFQLKPHILWVEMCRKNYSDMFSEPMNDIPVHIIGQSLDATFDGPHQKTLMEIMFELYEKTIKVSQLYKLAGNVSLSEKYRQDAEKIYTEIQQIEDSLERKWEELQTNPQGRRVPPGTLWSHAFKGRHTLPTSG